jgi:Tol biopolymer transport system component
LDVKSGSITQLTSTTEREAIPTFTADESAILFSKENNLYKLSLAKGQLVQLTNFVKRQAAHQKEYR